MTLSPDESKKPPRRTRAPKAKPAVEPEAVTEEAAVEPEVEADEVTAEPEVDTEEAAVPDEAEAEAAPAAAEDQPTEPAPVVPAPLDVPASFIAPKPAEPRAVRPDSAFIRSPRFIDSTIVVAVVIGALIGGLSSAAVGHYNGSIPQSIVINNPESVTEVAAAAAVAGRSVVTIDVAVEGGGGTGSGVVISPDGYILTNAHVVTLDGGSEKTRLTVTTDQGQRYPAEIVGLDTVTDLAVIKVTGATGFTPIAWADSDKINIGDTAVGIGAPVGLSGTVTSGIISALNRGVVLDDPAGTAEDAEKKTIWVPAIQTDAAINHGNSGGPLLNGSGELIGVNVAIASGDEGANAGNFGVGFAIESNVARRIANEIIKSGSASHALLGASVTASGSSTAGASIVSVVKGSAADTAGLQVADVIIRFNGKKISSSSDLTAQVRAAAAGSESQIVYIRGDRATTVNLALGDLADIQK